LFCWSRFDEARNIDFHGLAWIRAEGGNVLVDPLPMSDHDLAHLRQLGGARHIVLTNADHVRGAVALAETLGAEIAAPAGDRDLPDLGGVPVARWLEGGDVYEGLRVLHVRGSKTPGEIALLTQMGDTLIFGDVVRGQRAGSLNLLPDAKLKDKAAVLESLRPLLDLPGLTAVVVGDGHSAFRHGREALAEVLA
jgi:hypothetical protein